MSEYVVIDEDYFNVLSLKYKSKYIIIALNVLITHRTMMTSEALSRVSPQLPVPDHGPVGWDVAHCGAALWVSALRFSSTRIPHLLKETKMF